MSIIDMHSIARECGAMGGKTLLMDESALTAFAARIRAEEREKCAMLCDELARIYSRLQQADGEHYADVCGATIRAHEG